MQSSHQENAEPLTWLTLEDQARLAAFRGYAVNHALLKDVDAQLIRAILEPAGFAYVLVYGPSGVGKTRLIEQVERRVQALFANLPTPVEETGSWRSRSDGLRLPPHPLVALEAQPPDGPTFDRANYYRNILAKLGELYYRQWSLVEINADQTWETKTRSKGRGRAIQFNEAPELRRATQEALIRRDVRVILVDEAQHLMKVENGAQLRGQLNWMKSMTNETKVLHVLVGTYELLEFCNLDGQTARRGHVIHFPRYQFQHEVDQKAFQGALHQLLLHLPLEMDMQDLMNRWYYFYERSIGCIGVLKDWLLQTLASSLRDGTRTLTLVNLIAHAPSNAQCERMALDATMAENRLHYTESSREHLWSLLGMNGIPGNEANRAGMPNEAHPTASVSPTAFPKTTRGYVVERAPGRDPVGETKPEEKEAKCPFAGPLMLTPEQVTQARVECPACGARRTLHPQKHVVVFPSHSPIKRKSHLPPDEDRWIMHGEIWKRSQDQA